LARGVVLRDVRGQALLLSRHESPARRFRKYAEGVEPAGGAMKYTIKELKQNKRGKPDAAGGRAERRIRHRPVAREDRRLRKQFHEGTLKFYENDTQLFAVFESPGHPPTSLEWEGGNAKTVRQILDGKCSERFMEKLLERVRTEQSSVPQAPQFVKDKLPD
jgi:hypothetical protein